MISKEERIAIVKDEIRSLEQINYRLTVRARVRKAVGDGALVEQIAKEMEKNEFIHDQYLAILKELGGEDES